MTTDSELSYHEYLHPAHNRDIYWEFKSPQHVKFTIFL
jgi:hypothetical protein